MPANIAALVGAHTTITFWCVKPWRPCDDEAQRAFYRDEADPTGKLREADEYHVQPRYRCLVSPPPGGFFIGSIARSSNWAFSQTSIAIDTIMLSHPGAADACKEVGSVAARLAPDTMPKKMPTVEYALREANVVARWSSCSLAPIQTTLIGKSRMV